MHRLECEWFYFPAMQLIGVAMLGLGLWLRFGADTQGLFDVDLNTQQFAIGESLGLQSYQKGK